MSSVRKMGLEAPLSRSASLAVTGADRDAARRFWRSMEGLLHGSMQYRALRIGEILSKHPDNDRLTWAFAAYRASIERAAFLEGIRLALTAAARVAKRSAATGEARLPYRMTAQDIEAAILALLPDRGDDGRVEDWVADLEGAADRPELPPTVRYA